ncbi:MAG TPA: hypothetical protein VGI86_13150, partial [Acidimicrobiia bacterium]
YGNERWHAQLEGEGAVHHANATSATTDAHHDAEAGVEAREHEVVPHESPPTMLFPLVILAFLAAVGGLLALPFTHQHLEFLTGWLEPSLRGAPELAAPSFGLALSLSAIAVVIALLGIFVGVAVYRSGLPDDLVDPAERRLGAFGRVLQHAYYFDAAIARVVSGPVTAFGRFLSDGVDRGVIDGAVNGIGRIVQEAGGGLRSLQTGRVRNYALGIACGTALLLIFMLTRVT